MIDIENSEKISSSNKINSSPNKIYNFNQYEEKCKIYLAEIYTLNKKIEKLNLDIETKTKHENELINKLEELETITGEKLNKHLSQMNEQKSQIEELLRETDNLKNNHSYRELIDYYENKIKEIQEKNKITLGSFSKGFEKLSAPYSSLHNRDEVWRNLIKKYENKLVECETEISDYQKKERKHHLRQKFFEKYCMKAEERIEEITKVSKNYYHNECVIRKLKQELETNKTQIKQNELSIGEINLENGKLKKENEEFKNFMKNLSPILKIDWDQIKSNNEENFLKNVRKEEMDLEKKSIIILIHNLKEYILILKENVNKNLSTELNIDQISGIINDIKDYTISLLKKIQILSLNQYYIINECCDLNERLKIIAKKNFAGVEVLTVLRDIKNSCAKLLKDFNPPS